MKVQIIQHTLQTYRLALFRKLIHRLDPDMQLEVHFGQDEGKDTHANAAPEPWTKLIRNRYLRFGAGHLVWQPCFRALEPGALIIVEQANSLLINYPLLFGVRPRGSQVAFWGHGKNFRVGASRSREAFKRAFVRRADWWFAYTQQTACVVSAAGFPGDRMTVVNNAIDDSELRVAIAQLAPERLRAIRDQLGIAGDNIALYCGRLTATKQLDLLVATCDRVRSRLADFNLIVIGEGPHRARLTELANSRHWLHVLGHIGGGERAAYFKLARVLLVPAAVGLVIADGFVTGTPIVTCRDAGHGPEIAYLDDGVNGLLSDNDERSLANTVVNLLESPELHRQLVQGCLASAQKYSLDNMSERFAAGLRQWKSTQSPQEKRGANPGRTSTTPVTDG